MESAWGALDGERRPGRRPAELGFEAERTLELRRAGEQELDVEGDP